MQYDEGCLNYTYLQLLLPTSHWSSGACHCRYIEPATGVCVWRQWISSNQEILRLLKIVEALKEECSRDSYLFYRLHIS